MLIFTSLRVGITQKHIFDVMLALTPDTENGTLDASVRTIDNAPVYYTLDGTEPTEKSQKYTEVVKINEPCILRTVAIRPNGKSHVTTDTISFSKSSMKAYHNASAYK